MRKTKDVAITSEGRDKGKLFFLTEMPTVRAEKWAARAWLALARSGVDVPPELQTTGIAGLAVLTLKVFAGVQWFDLEPLLDEMFECVQIKPDTRNSEVVRKLVDDDVEEVATRLFLRREVVELHAGFSLADLPSIFRSSGEAVPTSP